MSLGFGTQTCSLDKVTSPQYNHETSFVNLLTQEAEAADRKSAVLRARAAGHQHYLRGQMTVGDKSVSY